MNKPIITSLLDTDFYKFTMMHVAYNRFSTAQVEYRFKCRTPGVQLAPWVDEINSEIKAYCELRFQKDEIEFLRNTGLFKTAFLDFLGQYQANPDNVRVSPLENGEIDITIRGPWVQTILFEVPILAIVNEVYFRHIMPDPDFSEGERRLNAKIEMIQKNDVSPETFRISDFGTRRRFSKSWQAHVVDTLVKRIPQHIKGTSNVFLAKTLGIRPLGTMAHEYLQAMQVLGPNLAHFQSFALEIWAQEYRGKLGIALSDVVGFESFLKDFDLYFCKLYDGMRHDSGEPLVWGERAIQHYISNGIDPKQKTLLFSDSLTIPLCLELHERFSGRSLLDYGVGTNLTHDLGPKPINIVIKMTHCDGRPVAKLADSAGKTMCEDVGYLKYLKELFPDAGNPKLESHKNPGKKALK